MEYPLAVELPASDDIFLCKSRKQALEYERNHEQFGGGAVTVASRTLVGDPKRFLINVDWGTGERVNLTAVV